MNSKAIIYSSNAIWIGGSLLFLYHAFPDLWGTLKFVFFWLNGLLSDIKPDDVSRAQAQRVSTYFISALFICLVLQFLILAFPFVLTQSGQLVKYYADREDRYVKALSGRLDLARQLSETNCQLIDTNQKIKDLETEIHSCRQQVLYLNQECAELIQAVLLSRQTLAEQTSQHSKLNTKGDF